LREEHELALFMWVVFNEPGLLDNSMKSRGTVRKDVDDDLMMEYFLAVTNSFNQRWMNLYIDFT
jgi:hypothetical protein